MAGTAMKLKRRIFVWIYVVGLLLVFVGAIGAASDGALGTAVCALLIVLFGGLALVWLA